MAVSTAATHEGARHFEAPSLRRIHQRLAILVAGVYTLAQVVYAMAGVRVDRSTISSNGTWQLLALDQLKHHLLRSIWYLDSQPPLFNFATGLILKLPAELQSPVIYACSFIMGMALALATLFLGIELGLSRRVAALVTLFVIVDPANIIYQTWYFYTYPTAVLICVAALAASRYVRTRRLFWGLTYYGGIAGLVLLNTTFQWFWLVLACAPVVAVLRREWRRTLLVACVPLLLVFTWYLKNAVMFGTSTTSGWLGMNMARITTMTAPPKQIAKFVSAGKLTKLSELVAFQPLAYYPKQYQSAGHTGVVVLDESAKPGSSPNFNNPDYIKLSTDWLHDDLTYIRLAPLDYAHNVGEGLRVYFVPADQYQFVLFNESKIQRYARVYHLVIDLQLRSTDAADINTQVSQRIFPRLSQIGLSDVGVNIATVAALPFLIWRRRFAGAESVALWFLWFSCTYVLLVTSFTELGENERFRFDVGPLPLIGTAILLTAAMGHVRRGGFGMASKKPSNVADFRDPVEGSGDQ